DEQRRLRDPSDLSALSRRGALIILRIVEQDHAGWDLEALEESFWRLVDQMLERAQGSALAHALDRLRRLDGARAGDFRQALGKRLAEAKRLERAVAIANGAERPPLVSSYAQLLPPDAGPGLLAVLAQGKDASMRQQIAAAALARFDSCARQIDQMLGKGSMAQVGALLAALSPLPPSTRAELAAAAFANREAEASLAAIPAVAADPPTAVKCLAGPLAAAAGPVRMAAAQALGGCQALAEQAA